MRAGRSLVYSGVSLLWVRKCSPIVTLKSTCLTLSAGAEQRSNSLGQNYSNTPRGLGYPGARICALPGLRERTSEPPPPSHGAHKLIKFIFVCFLFFSPDVWREKSLPSWEKVLESPKESETIWGFGSCKQTRAGIRMATEGAPDFSQ